MEIHLLKIGDTIECNVGDEIVIGCDVGMLDGCEVLQTADEDVITYQAWETTAGGQWYEMFEFAGRATFKATKKGEGWASIKAISNFFFGGIELDEKEFKINIKVVDKIEEAIKDINKDSTAEEVYKFIKDIIDTEGEDKVVGRLKQISGFDFSGDVILANWIERIETLVNQMEKEINQGYILMGMTKMPVPDGHSTLKESYKEVSKLLKDIQKDLRENTGNAQVSQNLLNTYNEMDRIIQTHLGKGNVSDRENTGEFYDVIDDIGYYKPDDETVSTVVTDKASIILTSVTNIGMVVAILMLAILGIKYMLGSVDEKADYKKDMIPYLVGAGLLFGICTIVSILQKFGESINNI